MLFAKFFKRERENEFECGARYVRISTSLDSDVCPICAQFEGKIFPINAAPELPLCPTCRCCYDYYFEGYLPKNAQISRVVDFILPAKCTPKLYENHHAIYEEKNIKKRIQLCEDGLKLLPEFMIPYLQAGFPAPEDLACRDFAAELYMRLGDWNNALRVIQICMAANAYYPESGETELIHLKQYSETATNALAYITEHQGILQRDIYKKLCPPLDREELKHFVRYSLQIRKEPYKNTNALYVSGL